MSRSRLRKAAATTGVGLGILALAFVLVEVSARPVEPRPHEKGTPPEAALMEKLRELKGSNPPLALELARRGNQRFPDSPDAPERAWFEARALVDLQRFAEARDLARRMGERYPSTSWTEDVQRHLLTHPLPFAE